VPAASVAAGVRRLRFRPSRLMFVIQRVAWDPGHADPARPEQGIRPHPRSACSRTTNTSGLGARGPLSRHASDQPGPMAPLDIVTTLNYLSHDPKPRSCSPGTVLRGDGVEEEQIGAMVRVAYMTRTLSSMAIWATRDEHAHRITWAENARDIRRRRLRLPADLPGTMRRAERAALRSSTSAASARICQSAARCLVT